MDSKIFIKNNYVAHSIPDGSPRRQIKVRYVRGNIYGVLPVFVSHRIRLKAKGKKLISDKYLAIRKTRHAYSINLFLRTDVKKCLVMNLTQW